MLLVKAKFLLSKFCDRKGLLFTVLGENEGLWLVFNTYRLDAVACGQSLNLLSVHITPHSAPHCLGEKLSLGQAKPHV